MRIVAVVLLAVGPALFAQQRSASPFGRIVFPGGNPPPSGVQTQAAPQGRIVFPGTGAPFVPRPTFGGSVWASAPLNPPRPVHDHDRQPGAIAVPVAVPVYYNSGYYAYDPPPAQLASQYVPVNMMAPVQQPQPAASPVIIINQYFRGDEPPVTETAPQQGAVLAPPVAQDAAPVAAAPDRNDPIFMIAMKDHYVHTARAYWIEDGMLNFISTDGAEHSVPLADVDRDLSRRLNRDRNVAFGLPAN